MSNIKDLVKDSISRYSSGQLDARAGTNTKSAIDNHVSECFNLLSKNSLNPSSFSGIKKYIAQCVFNEKTSSSSSSSSSSDTTSSSSTDPKIYSKFNEDESTVKGFVAMAGNEAFICPYQNQFNFLSSNYWTPHGLESNKLTFKKFFPTSSGLNSSSNAASQNSILPIGNGKVFVVNRDKLKAYSAGRSDIKAIQSGTGCITIDFSSLVEDISYYTFGKIKLLNNRFILVQIFEFSDSDNYAAANTPAISYRSMNTRNLSKYVWFAKGHFLIFDTKYNTVQILKSKGSKPNIQKANLCLGYNDFIVHKNRLFFVKTKEQKISSTCSVQTYKIDGNYANSNTTMVSAYSRIKAGSKANIYLDGFSFSLNELIFNEPTLQNTSFSFIESELDVVTFNHTNMYKFSNASIPTMCKLAANDAMPFKFYAQLYYSGIAPFSSSSVNIDEIYSSFELEYAANKFVNKDPSKYIELVQLFFEFSKTKKIVDFESIDLAKDSIMGSSKFYSLLNASPLNGYGAIHLSMDLGTCAIYNGQLIFELAYIEKNSVLSLKSNTLVYELSGEPGISFSTFHDITKDLYRPLELQNTGNRLGPYFRTSFTLNGRTINANTMTTIFSYTKSNFISFGEIVLVREILKANANTTNKLEKLGLKVENKITDLDKYLTKILMKDINDNKGTKCQDCVDYCKELHKNDENYDLTSCDKLKYTPDIIGFRWVLGKDLTHSVAFKKYTNADSMRYWACEILMRTALSSKGSIGRYDLNKSIDQAYRFECPGYNVIPYESEYKSKGNVWLSGTPISPFNVLPIPQPNTYSFFNNNLEFTSSATPSIGGMKPANETFLVTFSGNINDNNIRPILVFGGNHMFNIRAGAKHWAYSYPEASFYDPLYMYTGAPLAVELNSPLTTELSFLSSTDYNSKVDSRSALLGYFGGYYTSAILNTEMKWEDLFSSQIDDPTEDYSILGFAPGIYFTRNGSHPIEGRNKLIYDMALSPVNPQHILVNAFHLYSEYDSIDKKYTINNYALDASTYQMPLEHSSATLIPIGIADPMTYWWSKTIPAPADDAKPLWGICKIFPEATL